MAKKQPKKKAATKPATAVAAVEVKPAPKPIDAVKLDRFAEEAIEKHFGYHSAFEKQRDKVEQLESQLVLERQKLEHLGAPLRAIEKLLAPAELARLAATQPWDAQFKKELGRIELKKSPYGYGKKTEPTGAKTWADLRTNGATDEQIGKNLSTIGHRNGRDPEFAINGGDFIHHGPSEESWKRPKTKLIAGKQALIKETRRVLGIPLPKKAAAVAKAPTKKPTPRPKKPIAKKKSSKPAVSPLKNKVAKAGPKSTPKKKSSSTRPAPRSSRTKSSKSARSSAAAAKPKKKSDNKSSKRSRKEVSAAVLEQLGMNDVEEESKDLDQAYEFLKKHGPGRTMALMTDVMGDSTAPDRWANMNLPEWSGLLNRLEKIGRATVSLTGRYAAVEDAAEAKAESKKKPAGVAVEVSPAEQLAKLGTPDQNDAHNLLKEQGPMTSTKLAGLLNLSVDAAGAKLRRLIKKGKVRKVGELYELVAKPAAAAPPEDVALNQDFEQAIRDRGKKRNEVRKDFGGEEPIDELVAGEKSLQEEREFSSELNGTTASVVVDRTRKKAAKGTVRNPRATPFGGKPK